MTDASYEVQVFCLNAASMGVPQKRERVFFIGHKKELKFKKLKLEFNEKPILFKEIENYSNNLDKLSDNYIPYWNWCKRNKDSDFGKYGEILKGKRTNFNHRLIFNNQVCDTIATTCQLTIENEPRYITDSEAIQIGAYPLDYDFQNLQPKYLIGMSVPPVMTAQIANQIYLQWFK